MSWGYWHALGPKSHTRKIGNIHKDFQLNQFIHENKIKQLCSKNIDTFWERSNSTVWAQKDKQEKSVIFTDTFRIMSTFNLYFFMANCDDILIIRTTETTCYLTDSNFCHYPSSYIFDLAYTTRTNLIYPPI